MATTVSGNKLSKEGLGTWFFNNNYGLYNIKNFRKTFDIAIKNNINIIDLAETYGDAESFIGNLIFNSDINRNNLFLISKYGIHYQDSNHPLKRDSNIDRGINAAKNTLIKLKTDYLDLFMLHWYDYKTDLKSLSTALNHYKSFSRYIGICNIPIEYLEKLSQYVHIDYVQYPYNIYDDRIENLNLINYCKSKNIKIIGYGSFCFGSVFMKNQKFRNIADWRNTKPGHFGCDFFKNHNQNEIKKISNKNYLSILKHWIKNNKLDHNLIGFRNPKHLKKYLKTETSFNHNLINKIENIKENLILQPWIDEINNYQLF